MNKTTSYIVDIMAAQATFTDVERNNPLGQRVAAFDWFLKAAQEGAWQNDELAETAHGDYSLKLAAAIAHLGSVVRDRIRFQQLPRAKFAPRVVTDMQSDALMIALNSIDDIDLTRLGSEDEYAGENWQYIEYIVSQVKIAQSCGQLNEAFAASEALRPKS